MECARRKVRSMYFIFAIREINENEKYIPVYSRNVIPKWMYVKYERHQFSLSYNNTTGFLPILRKIYLFLSRKRSMQIGAWMDDRSLL